MAPIKSEPIKHHVKKQMLTIEQARKLLIETKWLRKRIDDYRNHAIVSLMLTSGMRSDEIIHARRIDYTYLDGRPILYISQKGRSTHEFVSVSKGTEDALMDYLKKRKDDNPYLFKSHKNE